MALLSFKKKRSPLSVQVKQYLVITGNYWAFTLTDGALRMLVVLYFHQLGYSPLSIAMLFLFYEIFGVITNLIGGWLGARLGLNKTMNIGLAIQIIALGMLTVPAEMLTVIYVMAAQALSGIAKDLNKMSAKSSIKLLVPEESEGKLYQWVAILTGSKNALKGIGFFLGGLLLTLLEFKGAIILMSSLLAIVWIFSLITLKDDLGKATNKPKFTDIFSKSSSINILSAARLFLFGARDVWFVVALPVFLAVTFNWNHWWVGGFMASWVIGYGIVQSISPVLIRISIGKGKGKVPTGRTAFLWASYLTLIPAVIALALHFNFHVQASIIIGLLIFGAVFAINSSLHSYLILSYADRDGVSLDVGFY
jgi:MFS transporter, APGE family, 1-arseno-3-phosphoglycerate exporter